MEDLQAFNNELVVRAIFGSKVPTIVSIGHDRDVPLAQMAADASASTPTATAVLVSTSWDRLRNISAQAGTLSFAMERALRSQRSRLDTAWHRLEGYMQGVLNAGRRLHERMAIFLERIGQTIERIAQMLSHAERTLAAVSPERQLRLGYSIVTDATGGVIRSADQLRQGQTVSTRLAKGSFTAEVKELQSKT